MIICFGIQFPQKFAALTGKGGLLCLSPLQSLKGAAGNKNCESKLLVKELSMVGKAFTRTIIPKRLHMFKQLNQPSVVDF
jgi:hypothetical protein